MHNFWQRTFTGVLYVALVLLSIVFVHSTYGLSVIILMMLAMSLSWFEFIRMAEPLGVSLMKWPGFVIIVLTGFIGYLFFSPFNSLPWLFVLIPLFLVSISLEMFRNKEKPLLNVAVQWFGTFYLGIVLFSTSFLVFPFTDGLPYYQIILGIFLLNWCNDTFAYLFGITLGKHRLFLRVSPKKSWEGAIGGGLVTLALGWGLGSWLELLSPALWLGLAFLVVLGGTFGDLFESLLKRSVNIKDSGSILPGHGGILDRFDSLLFSIPLVSAYIRFIA
jgi:phosphatidate cytidylyltransferase